MSPGSLSLRIEAVSLSYKAVTILNAGITAPNSGTAFYLYANQTGFNDTSTSTPNPRLPSMSAKRSESDYTFQPLRTIFITM